MNAHGTEQKCDCYSCSSEIMLQEIIPGKGLVELYRLPSGRFQVSSYIKKSNWERKYSTSSYLNAVFHYSSHRKQLRNS